jgi:hypothetical protein
MWRPKGALMTSLSRMLPSLVATSQAAPPLLSKPAALLLLLMHLQTWSQRVSHSWIMTRVTDGGWMPEKAQRVARKPILLQNTRRDLLFPVWSPKSQNTGPSRAHHSLQVRLRRPRIISIACHDIRVDLVGS